MLKKEDVDVVREAFGFNVEKRTAEEDMKEAGGRRTGESRLTFDACTQPNEMKGAIAKEISLELIQLFPFNK